MHTPLLLGAFGPIGFQELLILLVIVVFIFGARRIPEIARGLGEGIRGFRTSLRGDDEKTSVDTRERDRADAPKNP